MITILVTELKFFDYVYMSAGGPTEIFPIVHFELKSPIYEEDLLRRPSRATKAFIRLNFYSINIPLQGPLQ